MDVFRKWFCTCTGTPVELSYVETEEEELEEPACELCGATPSSDPKHTVFFRDEKQWEA
jgi:hypothetical protein